MRSETQNAQDAGGLVGPDVVAACALSSIPGVGATALARITALFGGFSGGLEAGPSGILKRAAELQLRRDALEYLAK